MKKEYIFLILIFIILYLLYLILNYKYTEYKVNNHSEILYLENENKKINIPKKKETLEYTATNAYKNKMLKEEGTRKNKGEVVIIITNEDKYNKFSKEEVVSIKPINAEKKIQDGMSINEKWMYFLFKKDVR